MREPQQARSRQTAEAIVSAAERLLVSRPFGSLTLDELVSEAGCTVGAFYHLFKSKDALLYHLEERFYGAVHVMLDALPTSVGNAKGLEHVRIGVGGVARLYHEWRGSLRALVLESHTRPDLRERLHGQSRAVVERIADLIAPHLEFPEPCVRAAIPFAAGATQALLREVILFGSQSLSGEPLDQGAFPDEVARVFHGYIRERCGGGDAVDGAPR